MAKYELYFLDDEDSTILQTYRDGKAIKIIIENEDNYKSIINLNVSTAIKFAKTLRTEINKAKEVNNG